MTACDSQGGVAASRRGAEVSALQLEQPLLEGPGRSDDLERGALLDGSAVTVAEVEQDVQLALQKYPREAIKWIEDFSCVRLGAFKVQVPPVVACLRLEDYSMG